MVFPVIIISVYLIYNLHVFINGKVAFHRCKSLEPLISKISLCYARVTEVEIHRLDRIYFLVAATTEFFVKVSMICT